LVSGDDAQSPKPDELTDTLPLTETLKIVEEPKVAPEPFRRKKRGERLRENVVRERVSIPPAQFMPKTKAPTGGLTLRQVTRVCFVVALVGYLLLAYLRMRTVAEINRAVQRSATKSTNTL
jgi:hypothetical protein